jgi:lysophospholipase L1-like esterase
MDHIRSAAIIGAITLALYVIVDWGYGRLSPLKPYAANPERLTASAYTSEPYFSEAFLAESYTQPGGWDTIAGTRLVVPREYHGKHFNVDVLPPTGLPYRRTINPMAARDGTRIVLLLGGSTVYDSEVPDDLTVASQLARLLAERGSQSYYVLNAGVSSVNTTQERERLDYELAKGLRPDVVIAVDGINDVNQGVYFANPAGVMFSGEQRNRAKEWLKSVLPLNIYRALRTQAVVEKSRAVPAHLLYPAQVAGLARATADVYAENVLAMHASSVKQGFRFYALLQPHFYSTTYTYPADELGEIEAQAEHALPQARAAFAEGYKALGAAALALRAKGVLAYDATGIFRDKRGSIFLDMAHVNSAGNRMLAEYMAKLVIDEAAAR